MAKRGRKKPYSEGSPAHLADLGLDRIKKLSESRKISDKLIAFNSILFVLILGLDISYWLGGDPKEPISFVVILLLSIIFALIISLGYEPILNVISNLTKDKVESLRIGATILFTDLSIALIGVLFRIELLVNISAIIIIFQLFIILLGALIDFSKGVKIEDKNVKPNQLREVLGDLASTITLINFIIWLITITMAFVR